MRPYCDTGDHIRKIPGDYRAITRGALVLRWVTWVNNGLGGWIIHRAIYRDSLGWVTRGDNCVDWSGHPQEDPGHMAADDFGGFWEVTWRAPRVKHRVPMFERE